MTGLPRITHLEYAVIEIVGQQEVTGQDIRSTLRQPRYDENIGKSSFYRLMGQMERKRVIRGTDRRTESDEGTKRVRFYRASPKGLTYAKESKEFFTATVSD